MNKESPKQMMERLTREFNAMGLIERELFLRGINAPTPSAPVVDAGARDERAAFEAWMMTRELDGRPDLKRDADDDQFYTCFDTQRVWRGWLARAALSASTEAAGKPVAWLIDWPDEPELGHYFGEEPNEHARSVPLYTAPPAASQPNSTPQSGIPDELKQAGLDAHLRRLKEQDIGMKSEEDAKPCGWKGNPDIVQQAASGQKLTDWRDVCAALIDIYDDAMNNAPEDRCYVDGAWKEELDKARALLAASDSAEGGAHATRT